jgi:hypothetical protein
MSLPRLSSNALAVSSLLVLSALPATAQTVYQDSHCSIRDSDYIELPNGNCMDLGYLSVLGVSQQGVEAATQLFIDALDANDYTARSYHSSSSSADYYSSTSITVRPNPTQEQIEENRQYLQDSAEVLGAVTDIHQLVAEEAFAWQTRVLSQIAGTMAGE